MPVTHGVAGSSPVQTAAYLLSKDLKMLCCLQTYGLQEVRKRANEKLS